MKNMTISNALKLIFIAEILMIFSGAGVIGSILGIVAFAMNLWALYNVSKIDSGYHFAFVMSVVGIVVSVISIFAGDGFFGTLVSIVSSIVSLVVLYYVITTTCHHLENKGAVEIAAKGQRVWKINLICTVVLAIVSVLLVIPVLNVIAVLLGIVIIIVTLVAYIMYLVFLWKSHKALA